MSTVASARTRASTVNIGPIERAASAGVGLALLLGGLRRPTLARLPLAVAGGYLVARGASGRCAFYALLDIDRAGGAGMNGITVDRAVTIERGPDEVYAAWRHLGDLPRFFDALESVEEQPGGRSRWVAKAPAGTSVEWDAELKADEPGRRIAWRTLPQSEILHEGSVELHPIRDGEATEVRLRLVYGTPGGSIAAAAARLFGKDPDSQAREALRRFKQMLEAGEIATTEGQPAGPSRLRGTAGAVPPKAGRGPLRPAKPASLPRKADVVQEASEDSFPASDAPAWTAEPGRP